MKDSLLGGNWLGQPFPLHQNTNGYLVSCAHEMLLQEVFRLHSSISLKIASLWNVNAYLSLLWNWLLEHSDIYYSVDTTTTMIVSDWCDVLLTSAHKVEALETPNHQSWIPIQISLYQLDASCAIVLSVIAAGWVESWDLSEIAINQHQ